MGHPKSLCGEIQVEGCATRQTTDLSEIQMSPFEAPKQVTDESIRGPKLWQCCHEIIEKSSKIVLSGAPLLNFWQESS